MRGQGVPPAVGTREAGRWGAWGRRVKGNLNDPQGHSHLEKGASMLRGSELGGQVTMEGGRC